MRQNLNLQNKTLQDKKIMTKMEDENFYGQKSNKYSLDGLI